MGLDISSYRGLRRLDCEGAWDGECEHVFLAPNPDFPGREGSVGQGCYEYAESGEGFRAGSYSGYNRWREGLAALVGTTPRAVWNDPARHADTPFVELINFSDCEGCIGPEVAAELAKDFAEWDERARATMDDWEYGLYRQWRAAFEMAADGGAVDSH
jgi:hypothetical protein